MSKLSALLLAVLTLLLGACGPELDRISEVHSLRVLAVQKLPVYSKPDSDVEFSMLWYNAAEDVRPVQRVWIGGCINPKANSYRGCVDAWKDQLDALGPGEFVNRYVHVVNPPADQNPVAVSSGTEDVVTFKMPPAEQILLQPKDTDVPPSGLYMVFYAACAGTLSVSPQDLPGALERLDKSLACLGPDGEALGADDFVVGYTSAWVFEDPDAQQNANPVVSGFEVNGLTAENGITSPGCTNRECFADTFTPDEATFCTRYPGLCLPACPDDGDIDRCYGHVIGPYYPYLGPPEAHVVGTQTTERMWVNYHVTRGKVRSDVRTLLDGNGNYLEFRTNYFAPRDPGWVRLWGVVRDDRGGVGWASTLILIQ